jgi:hypothetical protein
MKESFDCFEDVSVGNDLKWRTKVQPTLSSPSYFIEIEHLVGCGRPRVWVREPHLVPSEPLLETHRFSDGSLCLHTHDQWASDKFVADLIAPWISLWLTYYEGWLVTGEWEGGGTHPTPKT